MPYTSAQLQQFYATLTGTTVASIPAATRLSFDAVAQQNASGAFSDPQTLNFVINDPGVRSTFEVAVSTYQFFTGSAPTTAGINYLLNNAGTGLNTSAYTAFNEENRYYNFAVNLASAGGAGNATFVANYGGLTFGQTVSAAYENIVGTGNVGSAAASAAIADINSRIGFFTAIATTRAGGVDSGGAAGQMIALKAIVVGYILEEANKADVGTYAKAIDQFEASVAAGNQISGANLLTVYSPGGAGFGTGVGGSGTVGGTQTNIVLTTAADAPANTTGNVQYLGTIDGANTTLNPADQIRATGANNTLTITTNGGAASATNGALISGIQTVNVRAIGGAAVLDAQQTPGVTAINSFQGNSLVTANNVASGTTVGIQGNGTIQGGSLTANYNPGSTVNVQLSGGTILGGATTNLVVTGGTGTATVSSTGVTNSLDALTINGVTGLNLVGNSALTVTATTANNLSALTVSGPGAVDFGNTAFLNTVRTVSSTNTGGLRASFTATGAASLNITTSAAAVDRITLDAATATTVVNTGGGGDTIQVNGAIVAGTSLNGSGGATLAVTSAGYGNVAGFTAAQRGAITGFSTLGVTDALVAGTTYDINLIGAQNFTTVGTATAAPAFVAATGTFSNGATVNAASGAIVTFGGSNGAAAAAGIQANTGALNIALAGALAGANDTLTLGYVQQGTNVANNQTTSNVSAQGVETIQVIANRGATSSATSSIVTSISDAVLRNITFAGNEAFFFSTDITAPAGPFAAYGQLQSVISTSTASANIDVSTITTATTAAPISVTTGAAVDVIGVRDFARITAGAGNDIINVGVTTNGNSYSTFVDAAAGDRISFAGAAGIAPTKITLASTAAFQDYLDAATAAGVAIGQVSAFDFGGNTFLVENNNAAPTYQNGVGGDTLIQLVGIHTFSTTFGAAVAATGTTGASIGGVVTLTS